MNSKSRLLLKEIQGISLSEQERIALSIQIAGHLMEDSSLCRLPQEKEQEKWLGRMMEDPAGRSFVTQLIDLVFRSKSSKRVIEKILHILDTQSLPRFFSGSERVQFLILRRLSKWFPAFFLKILQIQIRKKFQGILLPTSHRKRELFLKKCRHQNVCVNLNHLGEAILGEKEAENRITTYLNDLNKNEVDYISVKVSTLYSQIQLTDFDFCVDHVATQLRRLYRAAKSHQFVNLDMEEFKDLDLTLAVFKNVLSEPEFYQTKTGIVLQSYLPESYSCLKELVDWAKKRNGAPIKIRIVKGANLAMECLESAIKGWNQAPFTHKWETDANFKRMLHYALDPHHTQYVHIGVASHNIFDIAYAFVLRAETNTADAVSFEMLSGMAPSLARVVLDLASSLTLYCPVTTAKNFQNAFSYLIRRLDENGSPLHFLRHYFLLQPGNFLWEQEVKRFDYACQNLHKLTAISRRTEPLEGKHAPDTDFSLAKNRQSLHQIYTPKEYEEVPLVIGGETCKGTLQQGFDPSRNCVLYRYHLADKHHVDQALQTATGKCPSHVFSSVIKLLQKRREIFIHLMLANTGKTVLEADAEVSEAIDFVHYYSSTWSQSGQPKGTVLVVSPWNFPMAIPTGGIAASLVTGNAVIFKPAPEATLVGWELAKAFWDAGVSKTTLQFLPCDEEETGNYLIQHPKLAAVILTGSTATAQHFLKIRPGLDLMAETGGKNAMIVSALADRDLAIRDLISSAFSHGGQKCSACSLAILEEEVYSSKRFLNQLKDAAESLYVGSSWDPRTRVPPLIRSPGPELLRALTSLDAGESWLLQPKKIKENLWTPGIKMGVKAGSFSHQTECFGPVLNVMRAKNLEHAIEIANGTIYGLTSGLHSLDSREHEIWKRKILAGNLYINRNIVGAIVERQPFGGCKASSFGPGGKAGGPLYCDQLVHVTDQPAREEGVLPQTLVPFMLKLNLSEQELALWKRSVESYAFWNKKYQKHQETEHLPGQQNIYYMTPKSHITIRYRGEPMIDLLRVIAACLICGTPYTLSSIKRLDMGEIIEDETACFARSGAFRLLSPLDPAPPLYVMDQPVLSSGRFEVRHYLREISLSFDYHRYGYHGDYGKPTKS
ncbi:MAG: bifunctional proline dehydrogenase/L-glutamate gamma-semialdehyde dehydrogenase [Verrucomicrobia bacterium]|nr:bifunctional proline dehydrogenase/L-glutamate gamma-semialdehyde dehydrogenase [Verrucomicrobiota bacterium]MBS0646683.1 bifunctional proline dehydrogenase/L-glutamate gamma-semialdehyde dehydrogenase [Verrucomicrobiota bacterium]